jgi:hypothetical protein
MKVWLYEQRRSALGRCDQEITVMRRTLPAAVLAFSLSITAAHAEIWSVYGINGNDTGGIIPWSPALRAYGYREAAQHHCGGYHKIARITSVHPRYGDYVGFACEFPRNYDPVGHGVWWMRPMFGIF